MDWLAGDFPSWLAAGLAVVAILLARRALKPPSYLEFHRDFDVTLLHDGTGVVTCRVTGVSPAVYFSATGTLRLLAGRRLKVLPRWYRYPLRLVSRSLDTLMDNTTIVTLEADGFDGSDLKSAPTPPTLRLDVLAQFSDGTKCRLRSSELELKSMKRLTAADLDEEADRGHPRAP